MEESQEGSSKGPTKTWGFRRTTLARREFLEEVGDLLLDSKPGPSRRCTRQSRGRGATRQTTPTQTAKRGKESKKTSPDASLASSIAGTATKVNSEASGLQASDTSVERSEKNVSVESQLSSEGTTDSDELTLKEYALRLKRRKELEEKKIRRKAEPETKSKGNGIKGLAVVIETSTEEEEEVAVRQTGKPSVLKSLDRAGPSHPIHANSKDSMLAKGSQKPAPKVQSTEDEEGASKKDEAEVEESPSGGESEDTDPDAVYCLCRQRHNKRFMICCDRCQEWFHGDCVGISEKRGCLMEKNGEDYICPNCSPCASPVPLQTVQSALSSTGMSSSSESLVSPSPCENRPCEDEGIKGKIRKASSEGTKKKIKIFQPGVKRAVVLEEQTLPKCIGPGCTKNALPDSVYCGHECILRHAAVAMKSLSGQKTPKPEPSPEANPTPKPLSKPTILSALKAQMKPLIGRVARKRAAGQQCEGEDHSAARGGADKEKEGAVLPTPQTETGRAQQASAIDASVFYKSNKKAAQSKDSITETDGLGRSKSPSEVMATPEHTAPSPANRTVLVDFNLLPLNPKPTPQLADSDSTANSRQQLTGAHKVNKILSVVPIKSHEQSPPSTVPSPPTSASVIASRPKQGPVAPQVPPEQKSKPNNQIRLNVRRSLTDMLWRRVNDSDDLALAESEVGNLAVNIEKAMYNMFLSTDSKYKNKYRLIMFNLKDPKNKVLFYKVIKGEISPPKLIRLSQDELQAREPSLPNISESTEAQQSIPETVHVRQDLKKESCSRATMKATPLSGVAVCKSEGSPSLSAASKDSGIKQNQSTKMQPIPDIISSMLKDTTSEHKTHLFDLKCRICTGQISADDDDEPGAKKLKKSEPDHIERPPKTASSPEEALSHKEKPTKTASSPEEALSHKERPTKTVSSPEEAPSHKERPPTTGFSPEEVLSHKERPSNTSHGAERKAAPTTPRAVSPVMESPTSPIPEDTQNAGEKSSSFTPIVIPEVSIVSVTRQDPRTAGFRPAAKPSAHQAVTPSPPTVPIIPEPKQTTPPHLPPQPTVPKSILSKPSGSSVRLYSTSRTPTSVVSSQPPPDKDTRQFLLKHETIWKGFLNMQTVAKFVTKGYLVSGSSRYLNEDIPDTINIGGRILPQMVWEYVEKVKTSLSKDLCLIRFQPATDEEEVAYVSLFSYFNSRRRFGVVSNHCKYIKDFYLIPLGAHESVPSLLLPLEGPGFERNRPNLLLGLAICQKPKPPETLAEEANETRLKTQTISETSVGSFPIAKTATTKVEPNDWQPYDPEIPISTTPPGSPDSSSSGSVSSPSDLANTVLSIIKGPTDVSSNTVSDSAPSVSTNNNPLQTILKTLFGKKGESPGTTVNSPEQGAPLDIKLPVHPTAEVDLIVQKYGHISKDVSTEKSEISKDNDQPYDPEEEYDPEVEYGMLNKTSTNPVVKEDMDNDDDRPYDPEEYYPVVGYSTDSPMSPVKTFEDNTVVEQAQIEDDIAYDPEDSTFFEEMQADLAGNSGKASSTVVLSEQQRMLLELNKQIEEQKRQLEEQEEALSRQRAEAGMSMAHFSVSDALLSPPRTSFLSQCDLLQLVEKQNINTIDVPIINQSRDPRQKKEKSCVENKLQVDSEHGNSRPLLESSNPESIPPETSPLMTDIQTPKQGSPVSSENRKTSTEKTNTKMPAPKKVDHVDSDDKSSVKAPKADTHTKAKSLKTETSVRISKRSDDAPRHSHHHRLRHELYRTSQKDTEDVSSRKRQRIGDSHEVRLSQPSSVNVKQSDDDKHCHRKEFKPRGQKIPFNKQTSRQQQRWEDPREFEPVSEMAQWDATFSHHGKQGELDPEVQFREQGPCPSTRPRGPPSEQFSDYDSETQHTFDRPFHSNQYDCPYPAMHRLGPRGPFGQPPRGPFENRGPRSTRPRPQRPPFRHFDVSGGPRMPRVDAPWRSNNNIDFDHGRSFNDDDKSVPTHMFRENQGDFSYSDAPIDESEMCRGGDLERAVQVTHFTPTNRFDEQTGHITIRERSVPDCEDYRSQQMVKNRRTSCPDPPVIPQHRQTFEEQGPPSYHLDYHGPRDCPPFSRPRVLSSRPFIESKSQPRLCLDKPDHQSDALPRRHSGPLLPTPPGGPIGLFNTPMQHPPQENPWQPQKLTKRRGVSFERETSGPDNARIGQDHFEEGYEQNHRENEDTLPCPSHEYIREQSEERRMSDGSLPRQRDRRPWPREQGWKRALSRGRGDDQSKGGDMGESEGETRRAKGGKNRGFNKRDAKRARKRNRDRDRDSHSSGQEDRNQPERTRSKEQKGGRFKGFGRKRNRGREGNRKTS